MKLNESSLVRLLKHNNEHDCAILTAYRSNKTKKVNHKNNEVLGYALQKLGYGITKVLGTYEEQISGYTSKEYSWFVVNRNNDPKFFDKISKFGKIDEQDTILYIPKNGLMNIKSVFLFGTNPNDYCDVGQKTYASDIKFGKSDNSMLTVISHKPFYFKFQANQLLDSENLTLKPHSPLYVMELIDSEIQRKYKTIFTK